MHDGHRRRLAGKALQDNALEEHELIELILCNACPRRDMNECAHSLLEKFGSVSAVMRATRDDLLSVNGVGENIADYIVCLNKCLEGSSPSLAFAPIQSSRDFFSLLALGEKAESDRVEIYAVDGAGRAKRRYVFHAGEDGKVAAGEDVSGAVNLASVIFVYAVYIKSSRGSEPAEREDGWCRAISDACKVSGTELLDFCVEDCDGDIYSYFLKDRTPRGARIRNVDGI